MLLCPYGGHDRSKGWLNGNQRTKQKVWQGCPKLWLILNMYWLFQKNMITAEYDTITLWLQYNMTPVFNDNVIEPKPAPWDPIWDPQPNFRNPKYPFIAGSIVFVHIFICNPLPYLENLGEYPGFNLSANSKYFITYTANIGGYNNRTYPIAIHYHIWNMLNDPVCQAFLNDFVMEALHVSSSSASSVVSVESLLSSPIMVNKSKGKWGSSLCFRNTLNAFKIFASSGLWSSSVKTSHSSDIHLSTGVAGGSEEVCRSPTDNCKKLLDIEFMQTVLSKSVTLERSFKATVSAKCCARFRRQTVANIKPLHMY